MSGPVSFPQAPQLPMHFIAFSPSAMRDMARAKSSPEGQNQIGNNNSQVFQGNGNRVENNNRSPMLADGPMNAPSYPALNQSGPAYASQNQIGSNNRQAFQGNSNNVEYDNGSRMPAARPMEAPSYPALNQSGPEYASQNQIGSNNRQTFQGNNNNVEYDNRQSVTIIHNAPAAQSSATATAATDSAPAQQDHSRWDAIQPKLSKLLSADEMAFVEQNKDKIIPWAQETLSKFKDNDWQREGTDPGSHTSPIKGWAITEGEVTKSEKPRHENIWEYAQGDATGLIAAGIILDYNESKKNEAFLDRVSEG